jgi:hypothetical protein
VSVLLTTFDVDEGKLLQVHYMVVTTLSLVRLRMCKGTGHFGAGLRQLSPKPHPTTKPLS